jgi:hypothetical protein
VVLKSAKDWILEVDTTGQHVPPCVQYGSTYLLITNTIGCVSCSVEWGIGMVIRPSHKVQKEPMGETLALQAGTMAEL